MENGIHLTQQSRCPYFRKENGSFSKTMPGILLFLKDRRMGSMSRTCCDAPDDAPCRVAGPVMWSSHELNVSLFEHPRDANAL